MVSSLKLSLIQLFQNHLLRLLEISLRLSYSQTRRCSTCLIGDLKLVCWSSCLPFLLQLCSRFCLTFLIIGCNPFSLLLRLQLLPFLFFPSLNFRQVLKAALCLLLHFFLAYCWSLACCQAFHKLFAWTLSCLYIYLSMSSWVWIGDLDLNYLAICWPLTSSFSQIIHLTMHWIHIYFWLLGLSASLSHHLFPYLE